MRREGRRSTKECVAQERRRRKDCWWEKARRLGCCTKGGRMIHPSLRASLSCFVGAERSPHRGRLRVQGTEKRERKTGGQGRTSTVREPTPHTALSGESAVSGIAADQMKMQTREKEGRKGEGEGRGREGNEIGGSARAGAVVLSGVCTWQMNGQRERGGKD